MPAKVGYGPSQSNPRIETTKPAKRQSLDDQADQYNNGVYGGSSYVDTSKNQDAAKIELSSVQDASKSLSKPVAGKFDGDPAASPRKSRLA